MNFNLGNLFRPVTAVQQVAPPMSQQNPGAAAPVPPAGTSQPTAGEPAPNPLDEMAALWQTDPKVQQPADPFSTPLMNTDPAKIAAAAAKMDFVGQVPQDVMQKAMSGTDPAAFMQVMNFVAQKAVATSAQLSAATIEQATARNNERHAQALPGRVKQLQLDSIQSDNPALNHPASQPMLKLVRNQIQMNNPNMSAVEINKRAEQALLGYAQQLVPAPKQDDASGNTPAGSTDWETWVNS